MKLSSHLQKTLFGIVFFLSMYGTSFATHLYGGELYYTHITANSYRVTMVLYGDCSAGTSVFSALYTAKPVVQVYNGTSLFRTMNLNVEAGAGTEVTPVCPLSLDSTTCKGGKIPGVRRFSYSDTITLSASSSWRFRSTGSLGSTSSGRSSTITNIFSPGSSLMSLEATLNNSTQQNSNPTFTTLPTPFFCINVNQEYNIGAVDSNTTDSLVYSLVDGIDASTTPSSTVTYRTGYSATSPLACATGTFSFSTSTGQLTFRPNLAQVSLVVYRVTEYRGTTIVGTSMREMNFIVLSTCSNRSPFGNISSVAGGTASSSTVVNSCKNDSLLTFNINPVDSDGNNINVSIAGLPTGATMSVTGNNTTSPSCAFSWNTASVAAGTYYFYITYQDNACPLSSKQTVVYTINIIAKPVLTISTVSLTTCLKKNVFDLIPSGTGSPWALVILQGASIVRSYTGLTGTKRDSLDVGVYTLNLTNANGCFNNFTYTINPPPNLTIQSATVVQPKCYASSDGSINILANGGLSPFQYKINSGSFGSSGSFSSLSAGTYTIQIKDANNCTKDTVISLVNPDSLTVNTIIRPALCNAINSGSVTIISSGGTGTLTYAMGASGSFGTSNLFGSLAAGTYIFRVRDSNNCIKSISRNVTDSVIVIASDIDIENVSCFGGNNGSISVVPNNGLAPYTFALGTGTYTSASTFSSLAANNYIIHIKDSLGCFLDTPITITQPTALKISATGINPTCFAGNNGSISVAGSGGKTPYTFALNTSAFSATATFSSLSAGLYLVTIKDSNNCTKDTSINLTNPSQIIISSLSLVLPKCVGSADGSASIVASGGTGLLTYSIDGSAYAASTSFAGIAAGSHIISVRDANNCTRDTSFILANPIPISIQSCVVNKPKCYGTADGAINILASGGTGIFVYRIGAGAYSSSGTFSGLLAGTYTIGIKDSYNCTKDTIITIANPDSISLKAFVKKNLCNGTKNGIITIETIGGTGSFLFEKNSSGILQSSRIFDSLSAGIYVIKATDSNNCSKTISVVVGDSLRLKTSIATVNVSCFGGNDGVISLSPSIGFSPYSFSISGSAPVTSSVFTTLTASLYTLQIKDSKGCFLDTFANISQPKKLGIKIILQQPSCNGYANGVVTAEGIEGTAPYTFSIDGKPHVSSGLFSGLISKKYSIQVKDAKGCIRDTLINLDQPEAIFINLKLQSPLCNGEANGSILVAANGGTPNYQYAYDASAPQPSPLLENLKSSKYIVKVIDANGCIKDTSLTLTEPSKLKVDKVTIINPTCENYADGSILLNAFGGVKPYTYAIDSVNFKLVNIFEKIREGQYLMRIRDSNNCKVDTLIPLKGYPKIKLDSSLIIPTKCFGSNEGMIELLASGGNPPLRYTLENSFDTSRKAQYNNLTSKNYIITAIDTTNCFKSFQVNVPQPEQLKATTSIVHNDCTGVDTNGSITAIIKGGTEPYFYKWSFNNSTEMQISGLSNGLYALWVKDINGCTDSLKAEVYYDNCCTPSIPNAFTPNNDGKNDVFRIIYKGDVVLKELSIYNRYGQRVFTSDNLNQGWDGNFNGQPEELGVYYYMLRMVCGNLKNKEIFLKGDVTLIR